jgi:hypothetical protein
LEPVEQRERGGELARQGVDVEVVDRCFQKPQHVAYRTPVRWPIATKNPMKSSTI